jgi:outer membrane protein
LQILFNKESIKVQKEQLLNTQKQEIRTTEMVNAGMIPRGDLLDIKATVAADKQRLIAAENALFLSKLSLAQLMQLDDFKDFDVVEENVTLQESVVMLQTPEAIVEKAKQDRVELKITKTNLELAQKDIQIAKGAFLPSLSGFYSFDTRASDSPGFAGFDNNGNPIIATLPLFDQFSNNKGHVFGVRLSVPIFNGFAVKTNVDRTKIAFERSKIAQEQAEVDLERNVYNAVTDAKGALNSYQSAVVALTAREEAFNYAKERFAVGMMNSFDFNQAQTLFLNAQSEVLRTKYDYIFKQKVVEFYFGIPIKQKI